MLTEGGTQQPLLHTEESMMIRTRFALLVAVALGSLAVAVTAAWAGFPHFRAFSAPTIVYGDATSSTTALARTTAAAADLTDPRVLVADIVVVGIREGVETQLTAPFEAVYVCVNSGGNVPSAANKTTLAGVLDASSVFPAARNGRATGSLLTGPLPSPADAAAATGFACPSGQVLEFDRVRFAGLVLAVQGGESVEIDLTLESGSVHGLQ